ncbi:MAG: flavin-containing monooxygenase [Gaiellaceae bacterium]
MSRARPSACVIGAGASGIAALRALHERGIPVDCFEKSDRVGGLWVFRDGEAGSPAYRSLHSNTSRLISAYSDLPFEDGVADFPHHVEIARYLDRYVDHFGLRDLIAFETAGERAERRDDGTWQVALSGGDVREYDTLVVANGHNWVPRWPDPPLPGRFDGVQVHSHTYADPAPFEGRRVVVVGMGNSAMDIAVDLSFRTERLYLSARRGAHILPNYVMGKPAEDLPFGPRCPLFIRSIAAEIGLRIMQGTPQSYGLPKPEHRLSGASPTISSYILPRIVNGEVTPKPMIERLEGDHVRFADGSTEPVDAIVYCTGYEPSFPFWEEDLSRTSTGEVALYKRVFKPGVDNLFFVGLVQQWGALFPLAEAQSKMVAAYLCGDYALPSPERIDRTIERDRRALRRRYVASERHTMMVDSFAYQLELRRERRRGARRARARGYASPVTPRAGSNAPTLIGKRDAVRSVSGR